jgi:hypothetical protein
MPPTIDEMLANSVLTDDVKLDVPGVGAVTVGELRSYKRSKDEAIASAQREADGRNRASDDEMKRAKALAEDALRAIEVAETRRATPPPAAGGVDWDIDPIYSPINKRMREMLAPYDEKLKKLDQIDELKGLLGQAAQFVTDDYWNRRWDALKDKPKDKSYRDYVEVAQKEKITDKWGLPDPIAAYLKATESDRLNAALEAARKEGRAEGRKDAAAASMPRPGATPFGPGAKSGTPAGKDAEAGKRDLGSVLREKMAQAQTDPDILRTAGMID